VGYVNWVWDPTNNQITIAKDETQGIDEETAFDWSDVQQAITANGWTGVDWQELLPNCFQSGVHFILGTGTYFKDIDKTIIFKDGIWTEARTIFFLQDNSVFIQGTSEDPAAKKASRGCKFVFNETTYEHYFFDAPFPRKSMRVELYACKFVSPFQSTWLCKVGLSNTANRVYKCTFEGVRFYKLQGDLDNSRIIKGSLESGTEAQPAKNMRLSGASRALRCGCYENVVAEDFNGDAFIYTWACTIIADGLKAFGWPSTANFLDNRGAGSTISVIDGESDSWVIAFNSGDIFRKYRVSFLVQDANGNPLQGYTVKLFDKDNVEVYSEATDSEGKTPYKVVTTHQALDTSTTWDYRGPFKRRVESGAFYQEDFIDIDFRLDYVPITIDPPSKSIDDISRELKKHDSKMTALTFTR